MIKMKLKINNKYVDVSFWSLLKCTIIINLGATLMFYILIALLTIIFQLLK